MFSAALLATLITLSDRHIANVRIDGQQVVQGGGSATSWHALRRFLVIAARVPAIGALTQHPACPLMLNKPSFLPLDRRRMMLGLNGRRHAAPTMAGCVGSCRHVRRRVWPPSGFRVLVTAGFSSTGGRGFACTCGFGVGDPVPGRLWVSGRWGAGAVACCTGGQRIAKSGAGRFGAPVCATGSARN